MKLSKYNFMKISKLQENLETIDLLEEANFVKKVSTGSYVYLHLMQKIVNKINNLIREKLNDANCLEIGLTQLQSANLWKETGRYDVYGDEMFHFKDRKSNDVILAGTNEEQITKIASEMLQSYKDMNVTFYNISNKFRDELRCYNGLERCKEFIMMDAYSFHDNSINLKAEYANIRNAFVQIFETLGLKYEIKASDNGEIGGSISEEFIIDNIEIAHIFQLDDKYSKALNAKYVDSDNSSKYMLMGCYGIGISRLIQVIANSFRKNNFLNWGKFSSYDIGIIVADVNNETQLKFAEKLYDILKKKHDVYLDDRQMKIGAKLFEIDTIGTYNKIIVGKGAVDEYLEIKRETWCKISLEELLNQEKFLNL